MAKRAAQGAGTIRKKTVTRNGKPYTYWEARITTGRDPGTGKQVQRSISGKTQKEVREKLQSLAVAVNAGTYTTPQKVTVGEWLDVWLEEYVKGSVKPLTFSAYEKNCRNHLKPCLGAVRLQALSAHEIQAFINIKRDTLSPKTVKLLHGVLHKAIQKAVELRYIPYNPADACTLPKAQRREIKPLSQAEMAALMQAMKGEPYRNVYLLAMFTGMREGEVLGLPWDAVDFATGTLTVKQQLQRSRTKGEGQYIAKTPKNGKVRVLTPAAFVLDVLLEEKRRQTENRLKAGRVWENGENLVFTDARGRPLAINAVYKHYKRLAVSIGRPDSRFHDLRHTYAVTALQEGDDIKTVQEALGHATASFTLDVYGHVSEKMKQASRQRMDAFIERLQQA